MNSKKTKKEFFSETNDIADIDNVTKSRIKNLLKCEDMFAEIDLSIYNIQTCSSLKPIIEYRKKTLNRNNRDLLGAADAISKLEKFPPEHPASWIAMQTNNAIIVILVDRNTNKIIHAMSTEAPKEATI
ncbi:hypothetical protein V2K27_13510 [Pseudomonas alliivorans]|nr:hypothetical protein [Pseudomonas alliivorans]MEE4858792.1 hypothetical protein [Pseudomonas alliivorans]MEE4905024.1 hypothetical protein [Pseudomonas alliivorans]